MMTLGLSLSLSFCFSNEHCEHKREEDNHVHCLECFNRKMGSPYKNSVMLHPVPDDVISSAAGILHGSGSYKSREEKRVLTYPDQPIQTRDRDCCVTDCKAIEFLPEGSLVGMDLAGKNCDVRKQSLFTFLGFWSRTLQLSMFLLDQNTMCTKEGHFLGSCPAGSLVSCAIHGFVLPSRGNLRHYFLSFHVKYNHKCFPVLFWFLNPTGDPTVGTWKVVKCQGSYYLISIRPSQHIQR